MRSATLYVGNLSFYTTEEQIFDLFSKVGEIRRIIMGLDRVKKTPCGFCFVEYYRRCDAENSVNYISGTKLDERTIRVDYDVGFSDGRQYGRGRSGGQVRDEYRNDYDPGRGGYGKGGPPQTGMTGSQMWNGNAALHDNPRSRPGGGGGGGGGGDRPYRGRPRPAGRGRGRGGRGRGRGRGMPPYPYNIPDYHSPPMKRSRPRDAFVPPPGSIPPPDADFHGRHKRMRPDGSHPPANGHFHDNGRHIPDPRSAFAGHHAPPNRDVQPIHPGHPIHPGQPIHRPPHGMMPHVRAPMDIAPPTDSMKAGEAHPVRNERFDRGKKEEE